MASFSFNPDNAHVASAEEMQKLEKRSVKRPGTRGSVYDDLVQWVKVQLEKAEEHNGRKMVAYRPVTKGQVSSIRNRFYKNHGGKYDQETKVGLWTVRSRKKGDSYTLSIYFHTDGTDKQEAEKQEKAQASAAAKDELAERNGSFAEFAN